MKERKILLDMKGIEKNFPGVRALKGVDLQIAEGEIHALMLTQFPLPLSSSELVLASFKYSLLK